MEITDHNRRKALDTAKGTEIPLSAFFAYTKLPNLTCRQMVAYNMHMDKVFKALADSSRRQLLDELFKKNGQTLSELCEHLAMTRQSVTKHLGLLEEANLIVVEWVGRNKLHYLNVAPIGEIYDRWIGKYERHRIEALRDLKKKLEEENHD